MSNGDIYNPYATMSEGQLLDAWNTSNEGAKPRNELRKRLKWHPGLSLFTLLINKLNEDAARAAGEEEDRGERPPRPQRPDPAPLTEGEFLKQLEQILADDNRKVVEVAQPILELGREGGWNFEDTRPPGQGRFERPGDRNEAFLEDMLVRDNYIDELTDSQKGLLRALFHAFRYWYRRRNDPPKPFPAGGFSPTYHAESNEGDPPF